MDDTPQEDPFAQQGVDDPFAGQPTTDHPTEAAPPEPPIVDREGQPVDPAQPAVETQPISSPEPAPEPAAAPEAAPEAATPVAAPPAPPETPQTPAAPAAPEDAAAKSPMRKYRLIYQTAEKQWTEAEWTPEGETTPTRVLEARNNEHATRLAWGILGRPENGVRVLPIPDSSWKPKRLKAAVRPTREALEIS